MHDSQLALPFRRSEQSLKDYFAERLTRPLVLTLTDNATTMLSVRLREGALSVRLHRMFAGAGDDVLDEISRYLGSRKGAMPRFRAFIREHRDQLTPKPPKKAALVTAGKVHDLRRLFDEVNREYFNNAVTSAITWGTRGPRSAVRRRTLGSYNGRTNLIRINPVLDRKPVPRFFVAFIVYHEMLHAAMGSPMKGKRRSIHSREFRERERLFADYERAMAWERAG